MKYEDEYDIDDIIENNNHKSSNKSLIDDLRMIEDDSYVPSGISPSSFLPSSMLKEQESKKKDKKSSNEYDPDDWFNDLILAQNDDIRSFGRRSDLFDSSGILGKKKKKKKKKDGKEIMDYKKEFEPEMALYQNLLREQSRFTESLQREYDHIKSSKSSARGINKTMTDLISNINNARSLSMQLVEKTANVKKLVSDLSLKQKKELNLGDDGDNMVDFASTYLKQMLSERNKIISDNDSGGIAVMSEDDIFDELSGTTAFDDRSEDVEKYLEYENRNVEVVVSMNEDDPSDYNFIARDSEGIVIDDYPSPLHTSMSVNRSTSIATDTYGQKYHIEWR